MDSVADRSKESEKSKPAAWDALIPRTWLHAAPTAGLMYRKPLCALPMPDCCCAVVNPTCHAGGHGLYSRHGSSRLICKPVQLFHTQPLTPCSAVAALLLQPPCILQVVMAYTVGMAAALLALQATPAGAQTLQWVAIAALGFTIYGPQMLIGLSGAELVSPGAVGASQGILGWIAYLGAANAGGWSWVGWATCSAASENVSRAPAGHVQPESRMGLPQQPHPVRHPVNGLGACRCVAASIACGSAQLGSAWSRQRRWVE